MNFLTISASTTLHSKFSNARACIRPEWPRAVKGRFVFFPPASCLVSQRQEPLAFRVVPFLHVRWSLNPQLPMLCAGCFAVLLPVTQDDPWLTRDSNNERRTSISARNSVLIKPSRTRCEIRWGRSFAYRSPEQRAVVRIDISIGYRDG